MANSLTDMNGRTVYIGDKVKFYDGYVFTVEAIRSIDNWVWGSDLPTPYLDCDWAEDGDDTRNYHNGEYIELYQENDKTHRGSIIKFNFR